LKQDDWITNVTTSMVALSSGMQIAGHNYAKLLERISPTLDSISIAFTTMGKNYEQLATQLLPFFSAASVAAQKHQDLIKSYNKFFNKVIISERNLLNQYSSFLSSVFDEEGIGNITFLPLPEEGIQRTEKFGLTIDITSTSSVQAVAEVVTPKKKLLDMTEDEFKALIKKCITPVGVFSIPAYIGYLYSEYVDDAARVLLEVMFAFSLTFLTGHYNAEVKTAIVDRIQESMVVKEVKKVTTRYVKANPTDQVAFLRKESYLRQGPCKTSPVIETNRISKNTVFTILQRRNNWIKVEVYNGDLQGVLGWIEESKVVKFKKVK
jgi:hypothetical protein